MSIKTVVVIGAGIMGRGIAHVSVLGGFNTILNDVSDDFLQKARGRIRKDLQQAVELGKLSSDVMNTSVQRLALDTDMERAAKNADLVIEAVPERIDLKLVEIIRGLETNDETFQTVETVSRKMGKETVEVKESPGFVTSRINALIGNEAFFMLQEGIASARDIDKALKLGLNHPMGPFEMVDLVGLDTRLSILNFLHQTLGEKYRPCPLLVKYVKAGRLGKKFGKGVYEYSDNPGGPS